MVAAPEHAVCLTGLERSFPELAHNIHFGLAHLYLGFASDAENRSAGDGAVEAAAADPGGRHRRHSYRHHRTVLASSVGFFGVRAAPQLAHSEGSQLPPGSAATLAPFHSAHSTRTLSLIMHCRSCTECEYRCQRHRSQPHVAAELKFR